MQQTCLNGSHIGHTIIIIQREVSKTPHTGQKTGKSDLETTSSESDALPFTY